MGIIVVFIFWIEYCVYCYGGCEDNEGGERVGLLVLVEVFLEGRC